MGFKIYCNVIYNPDSKETQVYILSNSLVKIAGCYIEDFISVYIIIEIILCVNVKIVILSSSNTVVQNFAEY